MIWIFLEAALALAIGLFIVWWTWPKTRSRDVPPPAGEDPQESSTRGPDDPRPPGG